MPTLSIEMFDDSPKVGDKIKVMGKVNSIDEETGEVDVSYDDASIVKKGKKRNRDDDEMDEDVEITVESEVYPQDQSLDSALARSFPNTQ